MTTGYGEISSIALDPIEKKPLYHYHPGSHILSVGSFGCNLGCVFCQNYSIAHYNPETRFLPPQDLVNLAGKCRGQGSIGVAFTYNEPTVSYEYLLAAAPRLQDQGLKTVLVSNGYMTKNALKELLPWIDAVNIDVKAFREEFYRRYCKAELRPVKENVEYLMDKIHVEITTLIIPGLNDDPGEIGDLSRWLADLNRNTALHLSRYHPAYKMDLPPTSGAALRALREQAREHLNHVYVGNLPGESNDTHCLACGQVLVKRDGYQVQTSGISQGKCSKCQTAIDFIEY